ncbi:hypothetical protein OWT79_10610 [Bacteroides fragilis]|nr:hypothetical protein [Bacteroides fragilis]
METISLNTMISHWYGESKMDKGSRLDYNVVNFVTEAGEYSKRFFQFSFVAGGFYASGQHWKPRTSRWGKRQPHPVLIDSGKLRRGFAGENIFNNKGDVKNAADGKFKSNYGYQIKTTSESEPEPKKRGRNTSSSYAAFHNTDPRISPFTVNQHTKRKPVQRQFIGISERLDNHINTYYVPRIFKYFPL